MAPSSQGLSDLLSIGYKRTLYVALGLSCLTPGILHLYLEDRASFESLSTIKAILVGLAIASPVLALNMTAALVMVYLRFTKEKYREGKRLKEEVLSRIVVMSGVVATSLALNLSVVAFSFVPFHVRVWHGVPVLLVDLALVLGCVEVLKRKVDLDLFHHDFPG